MASEKVEAVIAGIEALNVLELVELKKELESRWGGDRCCSGDADGWDDDARSRSRACGE